MEKCKLIFKVRSKNLHPPPNDSFKFQQILKRNNSSSKNLLPLEVSHAQSPFFLLRGKNAFFYLKGQSNSSMTTTFWLGGLVQWQQYAFGWYCDEVLSTILALSEFILDIYSFNFNAHFGFQHSHLLELLFSLVLLCEFLYAIDMPKYFMEMGSHLTIFLMIFVQLGPSLFLLIMDYLLVYCYWR